MKYSVVRVGITGHTNLTADTAVSVRREIAARLALFGGAELIGVSCLAAGADSIFAAVVLAAGGRLDVVIPARRYREFEVNPDQAAEFDDLLRRARSVRYLDFDRPDRAAFRAANDVVIDCCDELFAVWDGAPGGPGSTADAVARAAAAHRPVHVIWPPGARRTPTRPGL